VLKVLESKTARIDLELKADPSRSDREIGRVCGVSHHTVGRRRTELGLVGNFGGENAKLGSLFAQEDSPPLQDCPENCPETEKEAENSPPDQEEASQSVTCDTASPAETVVLLPAQGKITIGRNKYGDMILRQSDWPNEDAVIVIASDYLEMFIDRLTDEMGIPSTKGLTR
jgi:hypothetical protein